MSFCVKIQDLDPDPHSERIRIQETTFMQINADVDPKY
jgi:hypothetical protein